MHGDHCFGIPGVLRAINAARIARGAAGATDPVHVYGPPGTWQPSNNPRHVQLLVQTTQHRDAAITTDVNGIHCVTLYILRVA